MITRLKGELEIDHEWGIIYFHADDPIVICSLGTASPLRIRRLPTPIPNNQQLDITFGWGINWLGDTSKAMEVGPRRPAMINPCAEISLPDRPKPRH